MGPKNHSCGNGISMGRRVQFWWRILSKAALLRGEPVGETGRWRGREQFWRLSSLGACSLEGSGTARSRGQGLVSSQNSRTASLLVGRQLSPCVSGAGPTQRLSVSLRKWP